ncbi:MAG TPA: Era-like GTP-binding protein [Dokdonella sp.]|uniref:Era-like GTP-binding protein n=1 Tax=Dokdonella sp. TaxID=2291710 RepID=UPI002D805A89|nr:Era-like GTP-binding protein [Dokdonella sp.]HET9031903.1 Era-like GTP-binding protein [Dokdonella sp.]
MSRSRLPLRLILLGLLAIAAVVVVWLAISMVNGLLEFYERLLALPLLLRIPLIIIVAAAIGGVCWLAWKLLRPAPRRSGKRKTDSLPDRPTIEARVADLQARDADASSLQQELHELDRRRLSGECHVALFGEISTGKSSLIRALASEAEADIDVIGGTTRWVKHFHGNLGDGRELVLADMPGTGEVSGSQREQLARDEALRAHAVIYLVASDLTRAQDAELRWLAGFGKPLILVLNKIDLFDDDEREALLGAFASRYATVCRAIVGISAGGAERFERRLDDGRVEQVRRERVADIDKLLDALMQVTSGGAESLEPAREAAVLASVDQRSHALAQQVAVRESEACVSRYTRRAVVGAMAAVAPGSDIIIQGALGTAMVRELARIHDVPVRELDVENLLARLGLTIRNTTAIVLAIAGNALKAFPGLGTLGGGVLHAIAYGLAFDSLGRAVALTLAEHARLDQAEAEQTMRSLLTEPSRERVERVARVVIDGLRHRDRADGDDH